VVLLYLLLPRFGILGYFFSFTVTHIINFILSLRRLLRISGVHINISMVLRTLLAAVLAGYLAHFTSSSTLGVAAGIAILGSLFILLKVVTKEDFYWLLRLIRIKNRP